MNSSRLQRFVDAQAPVWEQVKEELGQGKKRTHWMWFVFPQLAALGRSSTAKFYGISGIEEAREYFDHPLLGARLLECCELLLKTKGVSADEVFGSVDAMKFRSCLTLFAAAAPEATVFSACLARYFDGEPDSVTTSALAR